MRVGAKNFSPLPMDRCDGWCVKERGATRLCLFESYRFFRYVGDMEKNDPLKMIRFSATCRVLCAVDFGGFAR
jgi:hypothetical protein